MIILEPFIYVLALIADIYFKIVVVQIVLYWLMRANIVHAENKYANKLLDVLKAVTEPVYSKIRSKVSPLAGFDLAPFILLLALLFLNRLFYVLSSYVVR